MIFFYPHGKKYGDRELTHGRHRETVSLTTTALAIATLICRTQQIHNTTEYTVYVLFDRTVDRGKEMVGRERSGRIGKLPRARVEPGSLAQQRGTQAV